MFAAEFETFLEKFGHCFNVRADGGLKLRRELGAALDRELRSSRRGLVQANKQRFIDAARKITGVRWATGEEYRIITNLKGKGNGAHQMAVALCFLCCKTQEFDDIREALAPAPTRHAAQQSDKRRFLPTVNFKLADVIDVRASDDVHPKVTLPVERPSKLHARKTLDALIDGEAAGKDAAPASNQMDAANNARVTGRKFVEYKINDWIVENVWDEEAKPTGTLALIDIDDLTKINKVHGYTAGNAVLEFVERILQEHLREVFSTFGRCGDDTFYAVLGGKDVPESLTLMDSFCDKVLKFPWEIESLRVSVSIGVARYKAGEASVDLAIRAALGMKEAKISGKGLVREGPQLLPHSYVEQDRPTRKFWS